MFVTFCRNAPPCGDSEKFVWYHLLDHDLFYICTKFHSNRAKNREILERAWRGAQCAPLGHGRPQNSLGLIGLLRGYYVYQFRSFCLYIQGHRSRSSRL